jgi:hypothetical protein
MDLEELAEALKIDLTDGKYNFLFKQYKDNYGVFKAKERALEIMILDRITELVEKVDKGE